MATKSTLSLVRCNLKSKCMVPKKFSYCTMVAYSVLTTFIVQRLSHERLYSRFDFSDEYEGKSDRATFGCIRKQSYVYPAPFSKQSIIYPHSYKLYKTKYKETTYDIIYRPWEPGYECKHETRGGDEISF